MGDTSFCGSGELGDITVTTVESQGMPSGKRTGYNGSSSSGWSGDELPQNILDTKAPACSQCTASLSVLGALGTTSIMKPWGIT